MKIALLHKREGLLHEGSFESVQDRFTQAKRMAETVERLQREGRLHILQYNELVEDYMRFMEEAKQLQRRISEIHRESQMPKVLKEFIAV